VQNPAAWPPLQPMLEEGEIRLKTPEGGILRIPIHPSTTFIVTWNPGLDSAADRPPEASRSRLVASWELPQPSQKEQVERTKAFFAGSSIKPSDAQVSAAVSFFNLVRAGIFQGTIQQRGRGSKAVPGPRDLNNFVLMGISEGWTAALEQMRVFGDQNAEDRARDWTFITEQFAVTFGADGKAFDRPAPSRS
jgi:MoxR-like ATPase